MSKRSVRSSAVAAGNRTRAARKAFSSLYGTKTANVVRLIAAGLDNATIRAITSASPGTIGTYRSNLTRGTYQPFVMVDSAGYFGTCNYGG